MDWDRFIELVELSETGRQEEAIAGLRALVDRCETNEDNASVLLTIGACEKEIGQVQEARRDLARARSLAAPESWVHPRALFFEAMIEIRQENWAAVLKHLDELKRRYSSLLDHTDHQDLREEVERYRGVSLYELGRAGDALPLLEAAAKLEYEKPKTLYYLGRCCYDLGHLARAKDALREALQLDLRPVYQPSAHYVLGLAHHWTGQSAWAIPEFEWCLQHDKNDLVKKWKVLTALVNVYKALGQEKQAERYSLMLKEADR
jgi:tetratricopeptide (TPR) repeat protein